MALSIKNKEVEALARALARISKKPLTIAVRDSLARELERQKIIAAATPNTGMAERLMAIGREVAAMPVLDDRTPDEILGYDENGLPS
jgi:antitoxin VapB